MTDEKSKAYTFSQLKSIVQSLVGRLAKDGIEKRYLEFGGAGEKPEGKVRVPTDARSEFLANRAMGDWAEQKLREAITDACNNWKVVQYGNTDKIAAGDEGFKQKYIDGLEETRLHGKRPDLLIFPAGHKVGSDISLWPFDKVDSFVKEALGAVEVRSSKFEALKYMAVRAKQKADGKKNQREAPSFTVKVEDLKIVYRWMEKYGLPQIYSQVFFDSIFAINFLDIFRIIADNGDYCIEKPEKSQEKATIMIPITCGVKIGVGTEMPSFEAEHRVTELGRHDAYVVPCGGNFEINSKELQRVLFGA